MIHSSYVEDGQAILKSIVHRYTTNNECSLSFKIQLNYRVLNIDKVRGMLQQYFRHLQISAAYCHVKGSVSVL